MYYISLFYTRTHTSTPTHSIHSNFSCTKSACYGSFKCVLCVMLDENNKVARQRRNAVLCCCVFRRCLHSAATLLFTLTYTYANTQTQTHMHAHLSGKCIQQSTEPYSLSFNTIRCYVILESSPIPSYSHRRLWIWYTHWHSPMWRSISCVASWESQMWTLNSKRKHIFSLSSKPWRCWKKWKWR